MAPPYAELYDFDNPPVKVHHRDNVSTVNAPLSQEALVNAIRNASATTSFITLTLLAATGRYEPEQPSSLYSFDCSVCDPYIIPRRESILLLPELPSSPPRLARYQQYMSRPAYGVSEEDLLLDSPASSFKITSTLEERKQASIERYKKRNNKTT
jgi:hypothetical protein